jgi:HD superfamily phosphodiesterase
MSLKKSSHFHIKEFLDIIKHIIDDNDFKKLKKYRQHMFFNRYEHLINVSFFAYQLSRLFHADIQVCTLA